MKHVRLIRHGESAANAGQATLDHATITLTPRGVEQAQLVALSFNHAPALIVASPFTRAHSTAMATAAVFPLIPFETWPIHEFTYLEPARCANTAPKEPRMDVIWRVPGRAYQVARDPERLLVEERAEALSAAGYPLPGDDPAMYAEQRLNAARAAARSSHVGSVSENTAAELSAREVSQVLREAIFGRSVMSKVGHESWDEIYAGHFQIKVDGWEISIYNDCDQLDYCDQGVSPEGRRWSFDSGNRFGTDPVALLSTWEHQTLERMLKGL